MLVYMSTRMFSLTSAPVRTPLTTFNVCHLRDMGILSNDGKIVNYEDLDDVEVVGLVIVDLLKKINSPAFQIDPSISMGAWQMKTNASTLETISVAIIEDNIKCLRKKLNC